MGGYVHILDFEVGVIESIISPFRRISSYIPNSTGTVPLLGPGTDHTLQSSRVQSFVKGP